MGFISKHGTFKTLEINQCWKKTYLHTQVIK